MSTHGVFVRTAEPRDAEAISALQVRSWKRAYRGIVSDAFLDELAEDAWVDRWTSWLSPDIGGAIHQLVSSTTPDGEPCAVAACGPATGAEDAGSGQLYVLYTDPTCWNQGHGGALLTRVHALLAEGGHVQGLLWVAAGNDRAIRFYEHHGWTRDGSTRQESVAGVTFDELRMVRGLVP